MVEIVRNIFSEDIRYFNYEFGEKWENTQERRRAAKVKVVVL